MTEAHWRQAALDGAARDIPGTGFEAVIPTPKLKLEGFRVILS